MGKMTEARIEVHIGHLAPSIAEQFGDSLPDGDAATFDGDRQAILRLHVRGIITDRERDRACQRLTNEIARTISAFARAKLTPAGRKALEETE